MFDDRIPEEREERHQKLITLLQRGLREPAAISSSEQSQIIARVRERLRQEDDFPRLEEMPVQQPGQTRSGFTASISTRKGRLSHWVNAWVAVLVVGIIVGASLLVIKSFPHQNAVPTTGSPGPTARSQVNGPQNAVPTPGPTARSQINGLEASIHLVTPGPYFLSELVSVDVSLHTHKYIQLEGTEREDVACFTSALSAQITEGSDPSYTLPTMDVACTQPFYMTTLEPDQTLTLHLYLPVTKSGQVTIAMGAKRDHFLVNPLDGHWPSLHIHVDPQVPSNRMFSLHAQGAQVMIQVPAMARAHLLYMELITCDNYLGGGPADWTPLPTTILSQPACPTAHKHWIYIVSAPGYQIVSGNRSS